MDREQVIKGLEHCFVKRGCLGCPYYRPREICKIEVGKDALTLLKEQKAKWVHREGMDFIDKNKRTHFHGMCTNCGFVHDFIDGHTGQYLYCPQCGKAVKWE